jgi:uncharacterized small protein (DUF1192 family)
MAAFPADEKWKIATKAHLGELSKGVDELAQQVGALEQHIRTVETKGCEVEDECTRSVARLRALIQSELERREAELHAAENAARASQVCLVRDWLVRTSCITALLNSWAAAM